MKYFYLFLTTGLLFCVPIESVVATSAATTPVDALNRAIVASKKNPNALYKAIEKSFDFKQGARLSVGGARWKAWQPARRKAYTNLFIKYLTAIYQNRFKDYTGGGVSIYKVQEKKSRALIYARIQVEVDGKTLQKNTPVKINFSVYKKKNRWLISDVYFKGTISETAGFRAQFVPILNEKGYDALAKEITAKCKSLGTFCRL